MRGQAYVLMVAGLMMAGCVTEPDTPPQRIGMPNPASVYCGEQGGWLEIRDEAEGQSGYCHLPDGRVIEEWTFYRARPDALNAEKT